LKQASSLSKTESCPVIGQRASVPTEFSDTECIDSSTHSPKTEAVATDDADNIILQTKLVREELDTHGQIAKEGDMQAQQTLAASPVTADSEFIVMSDIAVPAPLQAVQAHQSLKKCTASMALSPRKLLQKQQMPRRAGNPFSPNNKYRGSCGQGTSAMSTAVSPSPAASTASSNGALGFTRREKLLAREQEALAHLKAVHEKRSQERRAQFLTRPRQPGTHNDCVRVPQDLQNKSVQGLDEPETVTDSKMKSHIEKFKAWMRSFNSD